MSINTTQSNHFIPPLPLADHHRLNFHSLLPPQRAEEFFSRAWPLDNVAAGVSPLPLIFFGGLRHEGGSATEAFDEFRQNPRRWSVVGFCCPLMLYTGVAITLVKLFGRKP
ncbi:hypothetical protein RHGRI_017778 [Rhododendron griersonianum]|uniref:Uncharacterized protein n=1 Tax=Rhododendron griersonianum TaxID=479676 RepID=A0AAV6JZ07_9ERIC|nr:hypothetical protein RHGRI_017778 [Rhododendron griersonianum]